MNPKRLILPVAFAALAFSAMGEHLSPYKALIRYQSWQSQQSRLPTAAEAKIAFVVMDPDDQVACYVMNNGDGFIVLSADDAAAPLLGYGEGKIADVGSMPASLGYWLATYAEQLSATRGLAPKYQAPQRNFQPIAPMLTTKWDQDAPYNGDCPKVNRKRCPTGCTATAMAQVLRYHQWPEQGEGEHSYSFQGATYSYDYASSTFDYSLMLDTYGANATDEQKAAVANLMYACGVAADMQYGQDESGAYLSSALNGLTRNLRYSKQAFLASRDRFAVAEWEESLYTSLAECGPVIYCGYSQSYDGALYNGHTFVVDGYSSDGFFHINWGWGGIGDGYFLLNALDTYGSGNEVTMDAYGNSQQAIFNLMPRAEGEVAEPVIRISTFGAINFKAENGELAWTASYANESEQDLAAVSLGISFIAADGSAVYAFDAESRDLAKGERLNNCSSTAEIPTDLAVGDYLLGLAYKCDLDDKIRAIETQPFDQWIMEVSADGSIELKRSTPEQTPQQKPIVSTPVVTTAIYSNLSFGANFTVAAPDDAEFSGSLAMILLSDPADPASVVASAQHITANLLPGEEINVNYVGAFRNVELGAYYLAVGMMAEHGGWGQPAKYEAVSELVEVTVAEPTSEAFAIEVADMQFSAFKENSDDEGGIITVTFRATCTSGYKSPQFYIDFYQASNNAMLGSEFTTAMPFSAGTEREVTLTTPLSSIQPGVKYFCRLMAYDNGYLPILNRVDFTLDEIQTGIADIAIDAPADAPIYNLQGIKVAQPLTPGLYIQGGKKFIVNQ